MAVKKCWVVTEVKGGWRLKLAYGSKDYSLSGLVLKTEKDVESIIDGKMGVVFVHLKSTKFPVKKIKKSK